jgi:hypothetical protein
MKLGHRFFCSALLSVSTVIVASSVSAQKVRVPHGTGVYVELDQTVTSNTRDFSEGDSVKAKVWRDIVVDGRTIITAGTPVEARISEIKKRKVAGIKGQLELEAISVKAIDGTDVMLDGGYDKEGRHRIGLAVSMGLIVAWPLIFIPGKNAALEPGVLFDCSVQSEYNIEVPEGTPIKVDMTTGTELSIDVLYDSIDPEAKSKTIPFKITNFGQPIESASVVTMNDVAIEPIPLELAESAIDGDCTVAQGTIDLKVLSKHFRKGVNRFQIEVGDRRQEIVLDIEI